MSTADTHAVLVRPVATNKWKPLAYAKSAEAAIKLAKKPRKSLRHGDLILAIDLAEISAIQERGKCLYFVNSSGVVKKAHEPPPEQTWFLEWEGPEANASAMLGLCIKVDRKLVVTTACAIARLALPCVPTGEHRPRIAIEMAEAWVAGKATMEQVKKARDNAYAAAYASPTNYACFAPAHAARFVGVDMSITASYVANNIALTASEGYSDSIRQLSHIVRQYIPLPVVLESLA